MRALLEDMKSGQVAAYDVPAPELQEGGILVRTAFSAISAGTEKASVEAGRQISARESDGSSRSGEAGARICAIERRQGGPSEGAGPSGDALRPGLLLLRLCARGGRRRERVSTWRPGGLRRRRLCQPLRDQFCARKPRRSRSR